MTKKELLASYRTAVIELEELQHQINRVGTDGRPGGCRSAQLHRSGGGTNNPQAAAMHLADGLEALKQHKELELRQLGEQVEALLNQIKDVRTYMVIQHYYVFAETDEQIGNYLSITRVRANQIRREYLESA